MPAQINGPTRNLSERLRQADNERVLPRFDQSPDICMFSDYGHEHQSARYNTYSFFLCPLPLSSSALKAMHDIDQRFLEGKRSLDFKKIDDGGRLKALGPFWAAARSLTGLAVTVAIDTKLGSLVREGPPRADGDLALVKRLGALPDSTRESYFRILHLVACLLGGIAAPGQRVHWVTDRDKILCSSETSDLLNEGLGNLLSQYLAHRITLDVYTEKGSPVPGTRQLMWVPDQLSGVWGDRLSQAPDAVTTLQSGLHVTGAAALKPKSRAILEGAYAPSQSFRAIAISLRDVSHINRLGHKLEWDSAKGAYPV